MSDVVASQKLQCNELVLMPRRTLLVEIYPAYDFAHPLCDSLENIT